MVNSWLPMVILTIYVGFLITLAQLKFSSLWHGLKFFFWIVWFSSLFQLFYVHTGHVVWHWGVINITKYGVIEAVIIWLRLSLILVISVLFTATTSPSEIANGISALLRPLRYIKVPVNSLSLLLMVTLRFIPMLGHEFQTIREAQISRGMNFKTGSILVRLKKFTNLLQPLLFNSFRQAQILSEAMISRGYQLGAKRSRYVHGHWHRQDTISWLISILVIIVCLIFRR